jgi:hypothetical protein
MTSHHHPKNAGALPATPPQLRYLRSLSEATGRTFRRPINRLDASEQIDALLTAKRSGAATHDFERRLEREPLDAGYATGFREDEITGYGASASWR